MRRALAGWALGLLALVGLERGLAHLAVSINAAGALLSPAGSSLEAAAVALAFLAARLLLVALVAGGAARTAAYLVGRVGRSSR